MEVLQLGPSAKRIMATWLSSRVMTCLLAYLRNKDTIDSYTLEIVAYLSSLYLEWYNGHNFTPEKRDNNYTPQPLTATSCLRTKFNL